MSSSDYENTTIIHYSAESAEKRSPDSAENAGLPYIVNNHIFCDKESAEKRTPLTINDPEDVPALLHRSRRLRP